ncbi:MAG: invasion associated locus B family protein [Rhizobiales bacterium]|nr:invasion associated locus B family protein [Hyphomicrobiales bacterium]NRB13533.1 invasion associated locus B family protein [Hyphomicrobiales bacterium]
MSKIANYSHYLVAAFGLLVALMVSQTANAAPANNTKYGDWLMHCSDVESPSQAAENSTEVPTEQVCALFQSVAAENRPRFGLTILLSKDDGKTTIQSGAPKAAGLIKILVPLGVLIPTGIGMDINGTNIGLTGFLRCLPNGCTAVATLTTETLASLMTASSVSFTVFLTPDDGLSIPIKLNGLAAGFAALSS